MTTYVILANKNVEAAWEQLAPWIIQAMDSPAPSELDHIKACCIEGSMQVWVRGISEIEVVLVTETIFYGGKLTLVLKWLSGRPSEEWIEDIKVVEAWARDNNFERIQISGALAWRKKMKPYGFTHDYAVIGKDIPRGLH